MDDHFPLTEKLYRAVYPPEKNSFFWRKDGTLSSAAFADPKGLSVDRGDFRPEAVIISSMQSRFQGYIYSLYVKNCMDAGAVLKYRPTTSNPFHTEIHGSVEVPLLSKSQRLFLAKKAVRVFA